MDIKQLNAELKAFKLEEAKLQKEIYESNKWSLCSEEGFCDGDIRENRRCYENECVRCLKQAIEILKEESKYNNSGQTNVEKIRELEETLAEKERKDKDLDEHLEIRDILKYLRLLRGKDNILSHLDFIRKIIPEYRITYLFSWDVKSVRALKEEVQKVLEKLLLEVNVSNSEEEKNDTDEKEVMSYSNKIMTTYRHWFKEHPNKRILVLLGFSENDKEFFNIHRPYGRDDFDTIVSNEIVIMFRNNYKADAEKLLDYYRNITVNGDE